MVFNYRILFSKKEMFNPFNMPYQPYFIIKAPSTTGTAFIFQQSAPFLFPQLIIQNTFQNGTVLSDCATVQAQLPLETNPSPNIRQKNASQVIKSQTLLDRNTTKEKIIKKPANRPASYLTERKYYLAQTLQEESNKNRKLRPRFIKKKNQKSGQKSLPLNENILKEKERSEISKCGNDFSQIIESSEKKNIEFMPQEVLGNSMKNIEFSISKEDSK